MGTWSHWAYFSAFLPTGFIVWIPARPWVIPRQVLSLEKHLQFFQQESPRDGPSIGFPSILLVPARKLLFHDCKISHLIDALRMPPVCKIAAPQMTFVKFRKGQGGPPLQPDEFEPEFWVHSKATVGGHLLVFWETIKFNSSSSVIIFSCYFRMWNITLCTPLVCSEYDLPLLWSDFPVTPGLSSCWTLKSSPLSPHLPIPRPWLCPLYSLWCYTDWCI